MKKRNAIQSITFISTTAAINAVFVFLNTLLPFVGIFFMIGLPLLSTLVVQKCEKKWLILYLAATFLLSLFDFQTAIFYVLPCAITGVLFGLLCEKRCPGYFILLLSSLSLFVFQVLATFWIQLIYMADMKEIFMSFFPFSGEKKQILFYFLLYFLSFLQALFTYTIVKEETKKLKIYLNETQFFPTFCFLLHVITIILSFCFLSSAIVSLLCFLITTLTVAPLIPYLLQKSYFKVAFLFILISSAFSCLFLFSYCKDAPFLLFYPFFIGIDLLFIIQVFLQLRQKRTKSLSR